MKIIPTLSRLAAEKPESREGWEEPSDIRSRKTLPGLRSEEEEPAARQRQDQDYFLRKSPGTLEQNQSTLAC